MINVVSGRCNFLAISSKKITSNGTTNLTFVGKLTFLTQIVLKKTEFVAKLYSANSFINTVAS